MIIEQNSVVSLFFGQAHLLSCTPIGQGNINDTYLAELSDGQAFVLQKLNHRVFQRPEAVMGNTLRVCRHLAQSGFPYQVPTPFPTLAGTYWHRDEEGAYWRAMPFISNSYAPESCPDAVTAYRAAKAYGAFARHLRDFRAAELSETIPGFHDTRRRWEDYQKVLKTDPSNRKKDCPDALADMMLAKPTFDEIARLKESGLLPLRVTHNDTKAGNVLFDRSTHEALAVIDLDTVMPGTLLSDFGDMVRTFVPSAQEDAEEPPLLRMDVLEAIKKGYLEETADFMTRGERDNLMLGAAWMAGEQALRFLTDFLAGDVYYKTAHPQHNLIRARNQCGLFRALHELL
jgi:Putative homoserine kinase type II (protein kinase fold)